MIYINFAKENLPELKTYIIRKLLFYYNNYIVSRQNFIPYSLSKNVNDV